MGGDVRSLEPEATRLKRGCCSENDCPTRVVVVVVVVVGVEGAMG